MASLGVPKFQQAATKLYETINTQKDSPKKTAAINVLYEIILLGRELEPESTAFDNGQSTNRDSIVMIDEVPALDPRSSASIEDNNVPITEPENSKQIRALEQVHHLLITENPSVQDIINYYKLSEEFSNSGLRTVASAMLFMISLIVIIAVVASIVTAISAASSGTLTLPILAATLELSTEAWVAYGFGAGAVAAASTTSATASVLSEKFYNTTNKKVEDKMIELVDLSKSKP